MSPVATQDRVLDEKATGKVFHDLRSFLKVLEEAGQLVRIKEEVDPEEIGAAGRASANLKNGPAVLCVDG